jgi:NADH-quinone oxidoreductase subunit L
MFVGWDGVGLCSYLLIGFWYSDVEKAKAGMKAFIVNRVGDFAFLAGMFLILWGAAGYWDDAGRYTMTGGTLSLDFRWLATATTYLQGKEVLGVSLITLACIFLFIGATGKSAQLPLYVWLPDAMAGPTPVSALIHAATMVTAGVYMVARMNFLFALSPAALTVVSGVGAATALFAATIGFAQRDIKKVLAYSTVSQLGFMFIGVGVGAFTAGIFHLMTHAFFKACLFLGAGSVIHAMSGEQDALKMGGLAKKMPLTFWTFLVSTLAIAGIPGLAGFFSKDEILWRAFDTANPVVSWWPYLVWGMGATAALGTAFYMFRLVYLTFAGECRADEETKHHIHESPWTMTLPLVVLASLAAVGGWLGPPGVFNLPNTFEHWLEPVFGGAARHIASRESGHGAEWGLMGFSVALAVVGILAARAVYGKNGAEAALRLSGRFPLVHQLVFNKYYVDEIYAAVVVRPFMGLARVLGWIDARIVDGIVNLVGKVTAVFAMIDGWIDLYLVDGLVNLTAWVVIAFGRWAKTLQTGRLQDYLYVMGGGAAMMLLVSYFVSRM